MSAVAGLGVALLAGPAFAAADPARYMPTQLIAESMTPRPGSSILVGFSMAPRAGWHGYWSNPGDAGIAPTVKWTAPPGVRFGPLLHPAPTLISADGISSFVHDGPHVLLARMTVPRSIGPGTAIPVKAELNWAACTATQCVPLRATFTLDLVAGEGARSPDATRLRAAQGKVPERAAPGTFTDEGRHIRLTLPAALRIDAGRARFFPDANDAFSTARATAEKVDGAVVLTAPAGRATPEGISGVVSDGRHSYRLSFAPRAVAPETAATENQVERQPAAASETSVRAAAEPAPVSQEPPPPRRAQWPWFVLAVLIAGIAALGWQRVHRR